MDLSVLIPARNEMFLARTIEDILQNMRGETEVIAVCDGAWADPPIPQHERVTVLFYPESIGQRAATNRAAQISRAKFIMKLDAHCAVAEGFDVQLVKDGLALGKDVTQVPRMYNLHAFDWVCTQCGERRYQGPSGLCEKCQGETLREILWNPRLSRRSDFMRFDADMKFQYWRDYGKRPEAKGDICDLMSSVGACFFMSRERFWEIGGLDEKHGSWGQFGTEIACKSWLSGGRHVVNKKTWFAHMFRTQGGDFGFPYPLSGKQVQKARKHSKNLWIGNKWDKAVRPLSWLIDKFGPVPDWPESSKADKSLVYYTDNHGDPFLLETCRHQTIRCMEKYGYPIISVSQKPIEGFGKNIVMNLERSVLSIFQQILRGVQEADTDYVFLLEHDMLYHPSHFDFTPASDQIFYYDRNRWSVCDETGKAVFYHTNVPSMLCANRELVLEHYTKVVDWVSKYGWKGKYGYSPPKGLPKEERKGKYDCWFSEFPTLDIRREASWSRKRMDKSQFRSERSMRGWTEADEIPGWGRTRDRFNDFLTEIRNGN